MMKITLDDIRAAQSRRAPPQRAEDENHARAVALLEILNRQRGGGIGGLTGFTPFLPSAAPGQSAVRLGAIQSGNGGLAAPQGNAPIVAAAGDSPAIEVPFGGDAFAAPLEASAAPGGAPKQFGFGSAQTIANQPLNAGIFSAGEEAPQGPIADDGGHNRRRSDDSGKPSAEEIRALRSKYRTIVRLGRIAQHHFSADNLDYWLSGKGGTKNVRWKWLMKQPSFRAAYERNMDKVERGVELLEETARSNGNGATASGSVSDGARILARGRSDFYYGSGESKLDTTANIKVSIGSNGKVTTKAEINHRWHDKYNWNRGSYARIEAAFGLVKIPTYDDDALKLKAAGYGADFLLESTMKEHWR